MQRALGYGITRLVNEHSFLMLYGPGGGRNGKDTLMETLQHVLGPVSGAVSNDVVIAGGRVSSAGSATPHLVDRQSKRIAWASEPQQRARCDIGQVTLLTGGGAISARQLHRHQYRFSPSHRLLLLTNHKPHADAEDTAFWHRLCPVLFNLTFIEKPTQPNERKRDTSLLQALKNEASGVLAWLVRGCLAWQQQGLAIPECVLQARREYQGKRIPSRPSSKNAVCWLRKPERERASATSAPRHGSRKTTCVHSMASPLGGN
ncbi:MAG TPA: phage/plasmid primase, P4 family [Ktedonobacteraceae bacterium]|jgi:putative DNA primase/helicase